MWLVIPVKDFDNAKQRLGPVLSAGERRALYRTMLVDVLDCACRVRGVDGIALVTRDEEASAMADARGARVLREPANRGHTEAVRFAARRLTAMGAGTLFTLPGDVPAATPDEIDALRRAHARGRAFTIAPSHDRKGSNAVLLSPPDAVALRFGTDSFYPHLAAARRAGIEPTVVPLPGIALDIDTPEDLGRFLALDADSRTLAFLRRSGIAARLAPPGAAQAAPAPARES